MPTRIRCALLPAVVLSLVCSCASSGLQKSSESGTLPDGEAAFTTLKSLVGTWERAGTDNAKFRIVFSLTANETVVVESWMNGDEVHSLTLYHHNGEQLLATHYCPQGNQPRLKLVQSDEERNVAFAFLDATNLGEPSQSHQTAVAFQVSESGSAMTRTETYANAEEEETTTLTLSRTMVVSTNGP